jgi:hypothetical protein
MPFTESLPAAFYEDLPYLATHPSATADLETLNSAATERNDHLTEIICRTGEPAADAIVRKRKLVLNYASQIDDEAGAVISNFATRYDGGERLWANKLWHSSFV